MDCELTEKVSLLLDAELTPQETLRVKEHILVCPACRQAQSDFLRLRRELKAYEFQSQPFARARMLAHILKGEKPPLWRRRVSIPVPLMTLLLAIVVGLGVWSAVLRRASRAAQSTGAPQVATPVKVLPAQAEVAAQGRGVDFSLYDHGGRAAIYKVRRAASAATTPTNARQ